MGLGSHPRPGRPPLHLLGLVVDRLLLRRALEQACDRLLHDLARLAASA
ncbi:MAG: hypothetical protein ABIO70_33515 [Pseudomonadota bacterium]